MDFLISSLLGVNRLKRGLWFVPAYETIGCFWGNEFGHLLEMVEEQQQQQYGTNEKL